jgi:solute carrier family 35 protein F5
LPLFHYFAVIIMQKLSFVLWDLVAVDSVQQTRALYLLGLFFIFLQCLVWVFNAVLTQYIFENHELNSPFLMTYIGMSLLTALLPLKLWRDGGVVTKSPSLRIQDIASFDSLSDDLQRATDYQDYVTIASRRGNDLVTDKVRHWNHRKHFLAALFIAPAMFFADWAFNAALLNTSVASASVLVSIQSVFVYSMAVLARLELYSHWKLLGVLLAVAGTALTAIHDIEDVDSVKGDVLAVLAAAAYATYTIQVRLFCPDNEELYSLQLLLGYIGLVCFIPLLPSAIWIVLTIRLELTWTTLSLVVFKGLLDFCLTDYLLFRSILLTSATVATVGLGLTIPMAFVADWVMGNKGDDVISVYSLSGALTCSIGFLLVNLVLAPEDKAATEASASPPLVEEQHPPTLSAIV